MKWSNIPTWLKVVIVIGVVFLCIWILEQIGKHVKTTQSNLKEKLRKTQIELKALIAEKMHIQRLIKKVQNYVSWTLRALKLFLVCLFTVFTLFLVAFYNMDIFTATGTGGAFVGTIYIIVAWILNSKINNLKELEQQVSITIEQLYNKQFKVVPSRLMVVDERIILLEKRTKEIQLKLRK